MIAYNYATDTTAPVTAIVCEVLDFCGEWRTAEEIARALGTTPPLARRLIAELRSRSFLHERDRAIDPRERAMARFDRWNPAAGFFHSATKRVRFLTPRQANRLLREQARCWPMPSAIKRMPRTPRTSLPRPAAPDVFARVLLERRTWRRFSHAAVDRDQLATLLALSVGVQKWVATEHGDVALKTSPSGGARHPIECYVVIRKVTGVRPGLYHYAADVHALERIRGGDMTARLRDWMPQSGYFARAAFVLAFTAVFERQLWRYPYARAYRAALIEVGHVCQTFCLAATALGLAPFCLMGLADDEIERDLKIDGISEAVLYAAGAGARPRGPVPEGPSLPGVVLPVRPNRRLLPR
jgi:SagB-type dehydrogenase family enzyme